MSTNQENRGSLFGKMQKLGQSLMVPVSVLPGAGLIVALGRWLQIKAEVNTVVANHTLHAIGQILYSSGLAIFENLAVIFAIGVAIGFSGGAGVAGLSAAAGYFTLVNLLKSMTAARELALNIDTGVFGGIIAGLIAASSYKRFHAIKLHPVLGFFSGKRFVPIVSMFSMVIVGLMLAFVWPPIQQAISEFGKSVTASEFGPAFYAAGKRMLIPVGLHHVYYPPFLFEFGQYVNAAGEAIRGDSARYFAGDPTAGTFMASEFPIMLFGLPAAALAIVLRAKPERRRAVAGVMFTAALTSIITGITEPIEFAFIFVGPMLYVLHVALAFVSGYLTHLVDLHLGYTFSASLIDLVVGFYNQHNISQLLLVGPAIGAMYFGTFYGLIGFFDYKTPGRELTDADEEETTIEVANLSDKAQLTLAALGGPKNIQNIDACITRLRLQLADAGLINEPRLKALGAAGVMKAGSGNVQVVFGTESEQLKDQIKALIDVSADRRNPKTHQQIPSPVAGKIIPLANVPDPTFSQGLMGAGIAVDPSNGIIKSPVDGKVTALFHTNHAIGLESNDGLELLIHVGIDTVKMAGRGFRSFVKNGDRIARGQPLIEFDLDLVKKEAKSSVTPIVVTNSDQFKGIIPSRASSVASMDSLFEIER